MELASSGSEGDSVSLPEGRPRSNLMSDDVVQSATAITTTTKEILLPDHTPAALSSHFADDTTLQRFENPPNPRYTPSTAVKPRGCGRSRKRSAQCLVDDGTEAKSRVLPNEESSSHDSCIDRPQDASIFPPPTATSVGIGERPSTPSRVGSALRNLSILSPHTKSPTSLKSSIASIRPGSSFIHYSASPSRSAHVRPSSNSVGSAGSAGLSMSPSSSARSSQRRYAPLTVLQQTDVGAGRERIKTPTNRPPLYGAQSSLLLPLDLHHYANEDDPDEGVLETPKGFPSSVQYSVGHSVGSSSSMDVSPATPPIGCSTDAPLASTPLSLQSLRANISRGLSVSRRNQGVANPVSALKDAQDVPSPSCRHGLWPQTPIRMAAMTTNNSSEKTTPLPNVTLTPRSPASRGSLPIFPSPSDTDLSYNNFIFESSSHLPQFISLPAKTPDKTDCEQKTDDTTKCNHSLKTPALTVSSAPKSAPNPLESNPRKPLFLPQPRKPAYLPLPSWCSKTSSAEKADASPRKLFPTSYMGVDGGKRVLGVQTKSLLVPFKSDGLMQAMMDGGFADGSLTDDDDDALVLASPAAIADERRAERRARQRRSCSDEITGRQVDAATLPQSCSSPCSSERSKSSNSLVGMDIIHGSTSMETEAAACGDETDGCNAQDALRANISEPKAGPAGCGVVGFGNINGEATFTSYEFDAAKPIPSERDLVTPPAIDEPLRISPPLPPRATREDASTRGEQKPPPSSICISSADPDSVSKTIARMAYNANVDTA